MMKKVKTFFLMALVVCFVACNDDDDNTGENGGGGNTPPPVDYPENAAVGKVAVTNPDNSIFEIDSIWMQLIQKENSGILDTLKMIKIKLAEAMPSMDIDIPGLRMEPVSGYTRIYNEDSIIPSTNGLQVSRYTIKNFEGKLTGDSFSFTMDCGIYPVSFDGDFPE